MVLMHMLSLPTVMDESPALLALPCFYLKRLDFDTLVEEDCQDLAD